MDPPDNTKVIIFLTNLLIVANDMENFTGYHIILSESQVRTKPGCNPTKLECHSDRRKILI